MEKKPTRILRGITRVEGAVEAEALVTTERLSHVFNVIGFGGVNRVAGKTKISKSMWRQSAAHF